jgi:hypothetical protein
VKLPVMSGGVPAPAPGQDAGGNPHLIKGFAESLSVVALVTQQHLCGRNGRPRALHSAHLAGPQEECHVTIQPVAHNVHLGVQPAFGLLDDPLDSLFLMSGSPP